MNKVLFLVGPHATGKTYSSKEYIADKEDIKIIDTGPIMRQTHKRMDPDISIDEWVKKMELQYGEDITSQLISTEISNTMIDSECDKFILIGFRTLKGILYTVNHLDLKDYNILYIDASPELLYKNYLARKEKYISFEAFKTYINDELASGLSELKELALNNKGIDYYYKTTNDDNINKILDTYLSKNNIKTRKLTEE